MTYRLQTKVHENQPSLATVSVTDGCDVQWAPGVVCVSKCVEVRRSLLEDPLRGDMQLENQAASNALQVVADSLFVRAAMSRQKTVLEGP